MMVRRRQVTAVTGSLARARNGPVPSRQAWGPAVAAAGGLGTVSRRGRAPIGRVGPGPGPARLTVTRRTDRRAYGVGATLCLKRHGHVSLCVFLYGLTSLVITRQTCTAASHHWHTGPAFLGPEALDPTTVFLACSNQELLCFAIILRTSDVWDKERHTFLFWKPLLWLCRHN
jgi:hypothetical protein